MAAGLRATAKAVGHPPEPTVGAPVSDPTVNYNFKDGTYLNSAPIITANWDSSSGNQWTVPLGAGIGHIFHLGRLPVNTQIGGYYTVVRPDNGPTFQLRAQVQFMFPT